jgi:filamentous hemagglutinin family protein
VAGNPIAIPGFFQRAAPLPPVPANEVPVVVPGSATGLDTTRGDQGVASTIGTDSSQVTVYQNQQNAVIDWQTFNIGSASSVHFDQQGNTGWAALNRIWDANPSQIFGRLTADGRIYLINQNGILFGPGSRVNVNSLTASALNITTNDFLNNNLQFRLDNYQGLLSPDPLALVSNDGTIEAANGGSLFLIAPRVENAGIISAPAGQIGLAAGTDVLLKAPDMNDTRSGYYVIVRDDFTNPQSTDSDFGRAVNRESGRLNADGGTVGMYGNNVDQWGVIRSVTAFQNKKGQVELRAANRITTGSNSSIALPVDAPRDPETHELLTVSDTFDIQSQVDIGGLQSVTNVGTVIDVTPVKQIELLGSIEAPTGRITLSAGERAYLETGSRIDVSGVDVALPQPLIDVKLNSVELRDAYGQKDGVLQGERITTTTTAGSSIGDVSQAILTRDRSALERSIGGAWRKTIQTDSQGNLVTAWVQQNGAINISAAKGDIIVKQGAILDFSGGEITYAGGPVATTKLLSGTKIYDISTAPLNIRYDQVLGNYVKTYDRFGIRESSAGIYYGGAAPVQTPANSYTRGGDAGTLTLSAPVIVLDGQLIGGVKRGLYQNTWTLPGTLGSGQEYLDALVLSQARGLEAPRAGTLSIGDPVSLIGTTAAILVRSDTQPSLLDAASPLQTGRVTELSARVLNDAGLGTLNLNADLTIATATDARLRLQPGGSFSAQARRIEHEGDITVRGGSINLNIVQNGTSRTSADGQPQGTYVPLD